MAMTLGKDVSALFPDVLKNIATGDLEQKKLVYLYLMLVPRRASTWLRMLTGGTILAGTTPNPTLTYVFSP
jgi:vesicle coat complex subunit